VIYEDSQGNLWDGTTGALSRLDRNRARYTRFAFQAEASAATFCHLLRNRSGALWIGTSGQGLYRLDRGAKRFKVYRHNEADAATLANDTVVRLLIDNRGTLWAATLDGLSHFDTQSQRFVTYADGDGAFKLPLACRRPARISVGWDSFVGTAAL